MKAMPMETIKVRTVDKRTLKLVEGQEIELSERELAGLLDAGIKLCITGNPVAEEKKTEVPVEKKHNSKKGGK